jgi:hypothetical protein
MRRANISGPRAVSPSRQTVRTIISISDLDSVFFLNKGSETETAVSMMRPRISLRPAALVSRLSTFVPPPITFAENARRPPHILSLADLSVPQIKSLVESAHTLKQKFKERSLSLKGAEYNPNAAPVLQRTLEGKSIALIFNKRSTRTRVSSETSVSLLGRCPQRNVYIVSLLPLTPEIFR